MPVLYTLAALGALWAIVYAAFLPAYRLGPATDATARVRARRALGWAAALNLLAAAATPFLGYAIFLGVPLLFFLLAVAIGGIAGRHAFAWGALGCAPFPFLAIAWVHASVPTMRTYDALPEIGYASAMYVAGLLGAIVVDLALRGERRR